jgi:hypothetical protein
LEFGALGAGLQQEPEGEAEHGGCEEAADDPDPGGDFDRDGWEVWQFRVGERLERWCWGLTGGLCEEWGEH